MNDEVKKLLDDVPKLSPPEPCKFNLDGEEMDMIVKCLKFMGDAIIQHLKADHGAAALVEAAPSLIMILTILEKINASMN